MNKQFKQYLGDSVYADWDGYHVVLTTENGMGPSNTICLDQGVLRELQNYALWLHKQMSSPSTHAEDLSIKQENIDMGEE